MKPSFLQNTIGLLWPPLAPVLSEEELSADGWWWRMTCVLSVIPVAAALHHAVCYYQRCMFQPFSSSYEVTWSVAWEWLKHDPSVPWAILAAILIHRVGRRIRAVKILMAPLFISFAPLSLWVWDIFFLDRPICRMFHDGRLEVWKGFPVRGWHFYVLGVCLYIAFAVYLLLQYYRSRAQASPKA